MTLKQYFPISVLAFLVLLVSLDYTTLPIAPLAILMLVVETWIGLRLENRRIPRFVVAMIRAIESAPRSNR